MRGVAEGQVAETWTDWGDDLAPVSPREAWALLSSDQHARLLRFRNRLHASWATDAPHVALAAALSDLDPASVACVFPVAGSLGPRWIAQDLTSDSATDAPIHAYELLADPRLVTLRGSGLFRDRPVTLASLLRAQSTPPELEHVVGRVLAANDVTQQLRMVLSDRGEANLFAGLHRRRGAPSFGVAEHAALLATRPAIRQWARIAEAIGPRPLGDGALASTVQALATPAVLLRQGRALVANAAAAPLVKRILDWDRAGRPPGFADAAPLFAGGLSMDLVLPFATQAWPELPPSLRGVGALLGEGLADKEIARRLGMSLATVRTYVSRVFARTGVRTRRELMVRHRAAGPVPADRRHLRTPRDAGNR